MLKLLSVEMGFSELQLTPLHTLLNYSLVKPSAVSCFNGVSQMDVVLPLILNVLITAPSLVFLFLGMVEFQAKWSPGLSVHLNYSS